MINATLPFICTPFLIDSTFLYLSPFHPLPAFQTDSKASHWYIPHPGYVALIYCQLYIPRCTALHGGGGGGRWSWLSLSIGYYIGEGGWEEGREKQDKCISQCLSISLSLSLSLFLFSSMLQL